MRCFRIAFRADDAGLAQGVDEGVLDVVEAGLVRNVSVMATGRHFVDVALQLARCSNIEVGLHVTLNCEWEGQHWRPILAARDVPSLVSAEGELVRTPQELHARGASLPELVFEAKAQLAAARAQGLTIRYLDEHMGVGWLPGLRDELRLLAKTEGLVYADDLPLLPQLERTLPNASHFLEALNSLKPAAGLVVLHAAKSHSSLGDLLLPGYPAVMQRRIAEGTLFSEPSFVNACRKAGVEPSTISEIADATNENGSRPPQKSMG